MSEIIDTLRMKGEVEMTIEWDDGRIEKRHFSNTILKKGREAIVKSLANEFGDQYDYFISRMLFGNGGTVPAVGGKPRYVNSERTGLFGTTIANKAVATIIDPNDPTQFVITAVLSRDDAADQVINEMALQMHNGELYSMATFAGVSKGSNMSIKWSWRLSMI
jgi:hypothetical protein